MRGNRRPYNGHCDRADIFGILKAAFVETDGLYRQRRHPRDQLDAPVVGARTRTLYETVRPLVLQNRHSPQAAQLCEAFDCPDMQP